MVPQAAAAQPVPETVQVTAVLGVPVTEAVNCCLVPAGVVALAGETTTVIGGGGGALPELPQPENSKGKQDSEKKRAARQPLSGRIVRPGVTRFSGSEGTVMGDAVRAANSRSDGKRTGTSHTHSPL